MMSTVTAASNYKKPTVYQKKPHLGFTSVKVHYGTDLLEDLKDLKINMIDLRYYELP